MDIKNINDSKIPKNIIKLVRDYKILEDKYISIKSYITSIQDMLKIYSIIIKIIELRKRVLNFYQDDDFGHLKRIEILYKDLYECELCIQSSINKKLEIFKVEEFNNILNSPKDIKRKVKEKVKEKVKNYVSNSLNKLKDNDYLEFAIKKNSFYEIYKDKILSMTKIKITKLLNKEIDINTTLKLIFSLLCINYLHEKISYDNILRIIVDNETLTNFNNIRNTLIFKRILEQIYSSVFDNIILETIFCCKDDEFYILRHTLKGRIIYSIITKEEYNTKNYLSLNSSLGKDELPNNIYKKNNIEEWECIEDMINSLDKELRYD